MTLPKSRIPILILTLGALLRAATLGSAAICLDEALTLWRTGLPFWQLYTSRTDNSGPLLLDVLLRPLMAFGDSLWLLRLPSLLASFGCLWLAWKLMQTLNFSPRQQIIASLFCALTPGLLWIGQDARVYSLLSMIILAGIWFAVNNRPLGMAACMGLTIYCHHSGPVFAAGILCIGLYMYPAQARRMLLAGGIAALAWIPAAVHMYQLSFLVFGGVPQPWKADLTSKWLVVSAIEAFEVTRNQGYVAIGLFVGILSMGLLYHKGWKCSPRNVLLLALFAPTIGLIMFSVLATNIVMYRTFTPILWPFALWLGWEFGQAHPGWYRVSVAVLWAGMLIGGLALWHPADRGGHLDQAAAYIRSQWRTGDLVIYETKTAANPFLYYIPDLAHYTWPHIASNLLGEPGLYLPDTGAPETASRLWLVVVEDALITDAEQARFDATFPYSGEPLWRVLYMQAAPIDIYLLEAQ